MLHVDAVKQVFSINSEHDLTRSMCMRGEYREEGERGHTVELSIAEILSCHEAECGMTLTVHLVLRANFSSSLTSTS